MAATATQPALMPGLADDMQRASALARELGVDTHSLITRSGCGAGAPASLV